MDRISAHPRPRTAFVLGGGGNLGAVQVGMLRALLERDIRPDVVLGTSVGAINGVVVAADPTAASAERLERLWSGLGDRGVFAGSPIDRLTTAVRTGTALYSHTVLRELLESALTPRRIEDLPVRFQCVAASIERAAEHWFTDGPLIEAILASASVPGIFPPVELEGEHFVDGGLVNGIPVGRAVELGATDVYVLHVGRVDRPLRPPRRPWEVGVVAFEITRRHRYMRDLAELPPDVNVCILPTGEPPASDAPAPRRGREESQVRYRGSGGIRQRVTRAYAASVRHLDILDAGRAARDQAEPGTG